MTSFSTFFANSGAFQDQLDSKRKSRLDAKKELNLLLESLPKGATLEDAQAARDSLYYRGLNMSNGSQGIASDQMLRGFVNDRKEQEQYEQFNRQASMYDSSNKMKETIRTQLKDTAWQTGVTDKNMITGQAKENLAGMGFSGELFDSMFESVGDEIDFGFENNQRENKLLDEIINNKPKNISSIEYFDARTANQDKINPDTVQRMRKGLIQDEVTNFIQANIKDFEQLNTAGGAFADQIYAKFETTTGLPRSELSEDVINTYKTANYEQYVGGLNEIRNQNIQSKMPEATRQFNKGFVKAEDAEMIAKSMFAPLKMDGDNDPMFNSLSMSVAGAIATNSVSENDRQDITNFVLSLNSDGKLSNKDVEAINVFVSSKIMNSEEDIAATMINRGGLALAGNPIRPYAELVKEGKVNIAGELQELKQKRDEFFSKAFTVATSDDLNTFSKEDAKGIGEAWKSEHARSIIIAKQQLKELQSANGRRKYQTNSGESKSLIERDIKLIEDFIEETEMTINSGLSPEYQQQVASRGANFNMNKDSVTTQPVEGAASVEVKRLTAELENMKRSSHSRTTQGRQMIKEYEQRLNNLIQQGS